MKRYKLYQLEEAKMNFDHFIKRINELKYIKIDNKVYKVIGKSNHQVICKDSRYTKCFTYSELFMKYFTKYKSKVS